ncbi:MAG: BrnA antitoxin family protein [Chitinispirillia bacterium]|jgi:uncharacterized protein (DUF4415 family)
MKGKDLKKHSATNWEQLSVMSDEEIDLVDSPELDEDFFKNATLRMPLTKKAVSLRIDSDILEWYKKQGAGYQTRINAVLRMYMKAKSGVATRRTPSKRIQRTRKRAADA